MGSWSVFGILLPGVAGLRLLRQPSFEPALALLCCLGGLIAEYTLPQGISRIDIDGLDAKTKVELTTLATKTQNSRKSRGLPRG